jgi:hypothetical protein
MRSTTMGTTGSAAAEVGVGGAVALSGPRAGSIIDRGDQMALHRGSSGGAELAPRTLAPQAL